ncbi:amidase [Novacetimonas hansenii]|uniref:amidase family protein n=1 Tax=Novacetimonas hansenii TaxID=436 RepID=UPI00178661F7|nr:amidase family protein [Novacetimonas hansenii]QOF94471.1 amidase [Novacetimonas hansenii]
MSDEEIGFMSAAELMVHYERGRLSPVEVVAAVLRHIEATEPKINAMVEVTARHAMDSACRAEAAYRAGVNRRLEGVPVTIKDLQETANIPTRYGSWSRKDNVPTVDAPCVTRLHEAGAVMLGKTTVPEFGWKGVSQSPLTGVTSNPWKAGYNAGASSAGAGAAAAAGYGPLHQGGDGAGSIRMPAHFCGVFGMKPTHGRIPNWPISNNDLATHMGPLTRTVKDAALMLEAMSGPHPWDYTSLEAAPLPYSTMLSAPLKGRRIAYSPDLGHARVDPDVAAAVAAAVSVFEGMGATVEEVTPAWGPKGPELARFFWPATYSAKCTLLSEWEPLMDPGLVAMIRETQGRTMQEFTLAREKRFAYAVEIHEFFTQWDFLLTPAASVAAFPATQLQPDTWPRHDWDWLGWAEFSYPFNWAGNPAASIPCGFGADNLPVGLQVVGRRFDDLGVLQACAAWEEARPWSAVRPDLKLS